MTTPSSTSIGSSITPPVELQTALQARIDNGLLVNTALPHCPKINLWLLDPLFPQWDLSHEQAADLMDNPPFWTFCWASGQVLARYLLDNPTLVRNRTVLDFGAGSGIVGIAAKMAGAKKVICCDSDLNALNACLSNAKLNSVDIDIVDDLEKVRSADIATVADVFYDRDNLPLLEKIEQRCQELIIADSRLVKNELSKYKRIASFESHTVPDLDESRQFNNVSLYR